MRVPARYGPSESTNRSGMVFGFAGSALAPEPAFALGEPLGEAEGVGEASGCALGVGFDDLGSSQAARARAKTRLAARRAGVGAARGPIGTISGRVRGMRRAV